MEQIKILVFAFVSFLSTEEIPIVAKSAEIVINRKTKQIRLHQYDLHSVEQYRELAKIGLDTLIRTMTLNEELSPISMTSKHLYEEDGKLNAIMYLQYKDEKDLRKISFYADEEGRLSYPFMKDFEYSLETGSADERYVRFEANSDVKFAMQREPKSLEGVYSLAEDWKALENKKYIDVSELISKKDFEKVRKFIFKNGDRRTYRNFDSANPHYRFEDFDVYLGTGDQGHNFAPEKIKTAAYTELVIHDGHYYTLYLASNETLSKSQGHLEIGKVYWHNHSYKENHKLKEYLKKISEQI
ncbi:MAG: hypothetical protein AB8B59_11325 [Maribacter sp.]